jgi:hypothetical protein
MTIKAEALLSRYPNLSEQELATLINIFPHLRILDVGLMTADDQLSENLAAFRRDHGNKLKTPASSLIALAFLAVPAIVALGALWWFLAPIGGM